MRVRDEVPGSWEGSRGGGKNWGGIRVTDEGMWVTGWEGRERGEVREGASGLLDVCSAGTGGNGMICPPTVRTKTSLSAATALIGGESTPRAPGTVQVHGSGTRGVGAKWTRGRIRKRKEFGNEGGACGLRGGLRAGQSASRLILLHRDGRREVSGGVRTRGC